MPSIVLRKFNSGYNRLATSDLDGRLASRLQCTCLGLENGRYCHCPVKHRATLGEIVNLLHQFHDFPADFIIPKLEAGSFEKKLHAMYLSYLPKEATIFDYKMNCDDRGRFTELVRTPDRGQVSINISKLGITKGQH